MVTAAAASENSKVTDSRWVKTVTISHSSEVARNAEKEGVNCGYNLHGDFVVVVYLRQGPVQPRVVSYSLRSPGEL